MYCTSCGAPASGNARFCASCGSALDLASDATLVGDVRERSWEAETIGVPTTPSPPKPTSKPRSEPTPHGGSGSLLSSSDPIGGGRFTPGLMIDARYRIVALLGRGGMGEVYRAEDLKLSQVVAIKFLPESLSRDPAALERFHSEVRIARQVSHANVCRVFDVGDAEGIPYLTMEYVDGEDLASLIRRIGRLSPDKAVEVARQVCAGLAAAHERGVIHRDLKPANVMLDGAGKVRITDFGLAAIASNLQGSEIRAGTPAYMAPEQLSGREVSQKSDLYSLGLVLYEILTGKRAFEAATLPELLKLREQGILTSPSSIVRDIDPLLERVILRCLEKDPAERPLSALQVAAALPGGDPLAAALAAGETPSPEMVAAAGGTEGLNPRIGLACWLGIFALLTALLVVGRRAEMASYLPFADPPDALARQAREMISEFGYGDPAADTASGFQLRRDYLHYLETNQTGGNRWDALRLDQPPAIAFWYRQSPRLLTSFEPADNLLFGRVLPDQPPMDVSGSELVTLSPNGRLLHFEAVPPQVDEATGPAPPADWSRLFAAAGLDMPSFKPVIPKWFPLAWGDARAAWQGTWPTRKDIPLRVEAAAYRGKPIYFALLSPWDRPTRMGDLVPFRQNRLGQLFYLGLLAFTILAGIWIATRNLRLGRGDLQGSIRLALFMLIMSLGNWLLLAHHVSSAFEFVLFLLALSVGLFFSAVAWLLYIALEPYVRRRWPNTLISWTRMLSGQFRDPVLGRDVLMGTLFGVAAAFFEHLQPLIETALGKSPMRPLGLGTTYPLEGIRGCLASVLYYATGSLSSALLIFFVFFVVRLVLRRSWLAALVTAMLLCIPSFAAPNPVIDLLFSLPIVLAFLFVAHRFGLLAMAAMYFANQLTDYMPYSTPLNAWYMAGGLTAFVVILIIGLYAFHISRAGKPLFAKDFLDQ